jgi:hypothetical protein
MSGGRIGRSAAAVTALGAVAVVNAPPALAAQPWNGRYEMIAYTTERGGTSPASRLYEADINGAFTLSTTCSTATCVAVATGPKPSNPTVPNPLRYVWTGSNWTASYDWTYNCPLSDGYHKSRSPASSWVFYDPQPDGSLKGTWHTDVADGPCRGSIITPVAAFPG